MAHNKKTDYRNQIESYRNQINPAPDDEITANIHEKLHEKMQASAMDIKAFSRNGYVHLSGIVDLYSEKKYAEEIAIHTEGVKGIENKITVAMDSNITDKHIEKDVIDKLREQPNNSIAGVGVKVTDGVVNLMGTLSNLKDSNQAMRIASNARGVKDVVSNINIGTVGEYTDTSISNKIVQELSNTDLSFKDIGRSVSGGVVTLSGYLNSKEEVEVATEIAMSIEGVRKVRNHIKIRRK
ncbi:BON domain-containing protein [Alkaliphilus hydrothermalis]|uniref:Osmotically-inducible protein OsmY n=1 Tax=Alkaliphilus hydrothermalis TaxID=1482730 RepID=A0ABS2NTJ6_9FIRM|nr:BON domain-containing protein [Alkaliphilus hydrothermalis]MBM7616182.1 osmotically-inducible protein OsmY [Alkaliphilus hydrothermalis]